ncbi:MAG TPA: alpha-E domain-containing protein [Casimicrobiaceae bacterium]|nr:alpha-E domain-containing protein [Casimicrobiaceae bacterium]
MLCRTANELYWMARHIERAENTARLLDVTYRMSLLPYEAVAPGLAWAEPWAVPLITSGLATAFYQRFPVLSAEGVLRFLILDAGNRSSIYACLRAARESARSVRGAITSEMYEDLNSAWLEMRDFDYERIQSTGVSAFLEWVKMRSHLFRGVTFGTMLRDEAYHFIRLGTHIERADNTARILDVKYHTLLPSAADVGGAVDYYQWSALLRSVSGFESYRKIYSDVITPRRVAELLILRDDMPRSLHSCMNFIHETLELLCDENSRELERASGDLHARLHYGRTDDVIKFGLHEYLMEFLERISGLGDGINRSFLVPPHEVSLPIR